MKSKKKLVSASLAIVMAMSLTPLLAACVNPIQSLVEQGAQQAAEDVLGGDVDLNLDGDGASMPSDWPSDVPVIDGTIESSVRLGSGEEQTWSVTITVGNADEAWANIRSDFEGAGFTTDFESVSSDGSMGSFSNGQYSAIVSTSDDGSGNFSATYVVSKVVM
jgi:hypothetical protein